MLSDSKKRVRDWLMILAGTLILTVGVYFFKIPNGFAPGGVSGVGTILGRITPISPATWITILNVALLLIGFGWILFSFTDLSAGW